MNREPYASFGRRLLALIVDLILISIVQAVLLGLFSPGIYDFDPAGRSFGMFSKGIGSSGVLWILYFSLFESSSIRATPGKKLLGIVVVDYEGGQISFPRALGRTLSKYLSAAIIFIGFLMAAFTERHQALHDYIASTLVVDVDRDDYLRREEGETV